MENNTASAQKLFNQAIANLARDMKSREIGAILWDNKTADFHYIPEVTVTDAKTGKSDVIRVMGLYLYGDTVYLIEEDAVPVELTNFYTHGVEVPPTVVTLTEDAALSQFGDPDSVAGFTREASDEEWLTIADCYFEALNEN